jgi:hypothetical protein
MGAQFTPRHARQDAHRIEPPPRQVAPRLNACKHQTDPPRHALATMPDRTTKTANNQLFKQSVKNFVKTLLKKILQRLCPTLKQVFYLSWVTESFVNIPMVFGAVRRDCEPFFYALFAHEIKDESKRKTHAKTLILNTFGSS